MVRSKTHRLGYKPYAPPGMPFEVFFQHHQRGSTIVIGNLPLDGGQACLAPSTGLTSVCQSVG
jgi:hypothetical protein